MSNLQETRQQIAILRETKGQEQATLDLIQRTIPEAQQQQSWEDLAHLYFEQHLAYQHLVMNQRASDHPDQTAINDNLGLMLKATLQAKDVIDSHNLTDLEGDLHRFLGRAYTYQSDFKSAADEYEKAIEFYGSRSHVRLLEIQGFLAESFVHLGRLEDGLELAVDTFDRYESSPLGQLLKKNDYKTWAIWRSGIFSRLSSALIESNQPYDKELLRTYLNKSLEFLNHPEGDVTWGSPNFDYRIEEIKSALSRLSSSFS